MDLGPERLRMWLSGLRLGAAVLPSSPALALKRFALPVSYWRCAEFAYAFRALPCEDAHVLDVGSPKELAAILARRCPYLRLTATDILPAAVAAAAPYARALGGDRDPTPPAHAVRGPGRARARLRGRQLRRGVLHLRPRAHPG